MTDFHEIAGEEVLLCELRIPRARDFAVLVSDGVSGHVRVVCCYREVTGREGVVIDVKPTVPQRPKVPIKRTERLVAWFVPEDDCYPDVRALRLGFPREGVLHLYPVHESEPASLCLFNLPWNDIKLRLTANELLHRIQVWLSDASMNVLHRDDQPLEPMFLNAPSVTPLVLSRRSVESITKGASTIELGVVQDHEQLTFFEFNSGRRCTRDKPVLTVPLVSKPHEHNILFNTPSTFAELHVQLEKVGLNLIETVQKVLLANETELAKYRYLALVLVLKRKRKFNSEPELQMAAFFCVPENPELGLSGVARSLGLNGFTYDPAKRGQDIRVHLLGVRFELTPETAALYSGHTPLTKKLVGLGVGALGSQVVMQSTRGGLSNWTVIDPDFLLPHNLVRHELGGDWLGIAKASAMAYEGNNLFDESNIKDIVADFQHPGEHRPKLEAALREADAVVDMSASISVARDLAFDCTFSAKRCSLFVCPSGSDFVFIGEDKARNFRLDQLEAQYFRAVASDDELANHLVGGSTLGSCRDVTNTVPGELMALHAATGVRCLRRWLESDEASLIVTTTRDADASVRHVSVPVGTPVFVGKLGDWEVQTDTLFLQQLWQQRSAYLPNETGGVLLAQIDVPRRILYVCHQIPAPLDSERQPTMYIRGSVGLQFCYDDIQKRTQNNLVYIGEWHSHPDGCPCSPSAMDVEAGGWLAEKTREGCLPGIMLIMGEQEQTCWILCSQHTANSPKEPIIINHMGLGA